MDWKRVGEGNGSATQILPDRFRLEPLGCSPPRPPDRAPFRDTAEAGFVAKGGSSRCRLAEGREH